MGFCGLYTTKYVSSNLSQKVVSKLDQCHSNACMSKIYYNLILNTECAVYPVREVYCHINDSDTPPSSERVVDTHVSSRDMSDAMIIIIIMHLYSASIQLPVQWRLCE